MLTKIFLKGGGHLNGVGFLLLEPLVFELGHQNPAFEWVVLNN